MIIVMAVQVIATSCVERTDYSPETHVSYEVASELASALTLDSSCGRARLNEIITPASGTQERDTPIGASGGTGSSGKLADGPILRVWQ
jgi:hypothetical protein